MQGPGSSLRRAISSSAMKRISHLTKLVLGGIVVVAIALWIVETLTGALSADCNVDPLNPLCVPGYAFRTLTRMTVAYAFSLGFALAYGISTAMNHKASHVLLPLLDIFQSVPVLGFLPVVFLVILGTGTNPPIFNQEIASIILIFTAMAWAPTFGVISGINAIPTDIKEAAHAYGVRGISYLRQIVLPAVFPELVWSSILAWGGGWYLIPVEEHISFGSPPNVTQVDLPGIGRYIALAASQSDLALALFGLVVLVGIIFAIDRIVWKPLGSRAEKYKYETIAAPKTAAAQQSQAVAGVRRYEDRLVSPVLTFFKSERSYATRVVQFARLRRILHLTEKLRFPERFTRIPLWGRILSYAIFILIVVLGLTVTIMSRSKSIAGGISLLASDVTAFELAAITLLSLSRLVIAYAIALSWTLGAGILIARSQTASRWLVPIFDIGQSIPATALFPLVVLLLVDPFKNTPYLGFTLNLASVLLILTGMQWYLLFNIVGAVNGVPNDILEATTAYRIRGGRFVKEILIPASFPAILIGSIQAWGGGWNALIVSEFIGPDANVPGLGSFLVQASSKDPALATVEIYASLLVMTATVLIINRLVWRRLLRKADKYKFEA
ncbi:MAG TPA: ABC transporter permease subunit [Candidatus Bathyarchaeia archaeon]|nr:ABC transporter permease subunit [Candidatus Bathyarchaeia archaeon]